MCLQRLPLCGAPQFFGLEAGSGSASDSQFSKDNAKKHQNFIAKHDLKAPLASDPETDGLADALGIWVEKQMYGKTYLGMERSTFLVDAQGTIAQVWRKVKVKGHAAEVLAAAKAL